MNTVKIGEVEVKFARGMRFADFLKHNSMTDTEVASPLYQEAKQLAAAELSDEIAKRQLAAVDSKLDYKHRGGVFYVQPTVKYREFQADPSNEEHVRGIQQWAQQKRKAGEAAMQKARIFKASGERQAQPHTGNTSERAA
jgi:hypothetical protein